MKTTLFIDDGAKAKVKAEINEIALLLLNSFVIKYTNIVTNSAKKIFNPIPIHLVNISGIKEEIV